MSSGTGGWWLDSDVELNSSSESEDNTERLSEHAYQIADGKVDEEEESEEKSPGSGLVKMVTDEMLNLQALHRSYTATKNIAVSQAVKENQNLWKQNLKHGYF
jgi:hypothetical protein